MWIFVFKRVLLVSYQHYTYTNLFCKSYLSSYPGYFRKPHWKAMGLLEISRVTWQIWQVSSLPSGIAVSNNMLYLWNDMRLVPYLQMSCSNLATWEGTRILTIAMAERCLVALLNKIIIKEFLQSCFTFKFFSNNILLFIFYFYLKRFYW